MIPLALKKLVPFYTWRWRRRYRVMLEEIHAAMPALSFGQEGDIPWIEDKRSAVLFYGFWTEPKNAEAYDLLRGSLPASLPKTHFRLVKDYLTRFVYPHMRPDLKPAGYGPQEMWGFHGQHKDSIADQQDARTRDRLTEAFQPKPDDIIIDGGSFVGMGDIRMARDLTSGRIVAVEATQACYDLLCRNLARNNAGNVTPMHGALWKAAGTRDLDTGYAQGNSLIAELSQGGNTQRVATLTVDGIVAQFALPRVSMLSLTINGAEVEALAGAEKTLGELRPRIRLAGWYTRDGVPIWRLTKEHLERFNYEVFVGPHGNVMALPRD